MVATARREKENENEKEEEEERHDAVGFTGMTGSPCPPGTGALVPPKESSGYPPPRECRSEG